MQTSCKQCGVNFDITEDDLAFLEKVSPVFSEKKELIPPPQLCPECRMQQRMLFRNERNLYRRHCDQCHKMMICMYSPETAASVYCHDCWWSDAFSPLQYGREIDLSQTVSSQIQSLLQATPLPHLVIGNCDNSDYTNYSWQNRNCYLLSSSDYNEDCFFSTYLMRSRSCLDCTFVSDSELLYECIDVRKCYSCDHLQNCENCSNCSHCIDCRSCVDCIGCVGLRNKRFYVFNEPLSEEEFAKKKKALTEQTIMDAVASLKIRLPRKFGEIEQCERASGDHLQSCNNVHNCFDLVEAQDCRFSALGLKSKDCMDATGIPSSELCYQVAACPESYGLQCCAVIWPTSSSLQYCLFSRASQHCFGCVALHKNKFCIFNKQYTEDEYGSLVPKIINHMRSTGEWGEYFSPELSPFAYNETVAMEYFPLTKEEAIRRGSHWHDETQVDDQYLGPVYAIPDTIDQVPDEITQKILLCTATGKPYKIIPQELKFYRDMGIPIPRKCPDQRHKERMTLRNPRKLWNRECAKCQQPITTSYSPERPEIVYCEECYLASVY